MYLCTNCKKNDTQNKKKKKSDVHCERKREKKRELRINLRH
jgi:hypothetical protein